MNPIGRARSSVRGVGLLVVGVLLFGGVGPARAAIAKLGVSPFPAPLMQELEMPEAGVPIFQIAPKSPASKAGLRPGDLVTTINDTAVANFPELARVIRSQSPGATVRLIYQRDGATQSADVVLSADVPDFNEETYSQTAGYLQERFEAGSQGPVLRRELADQLWQAGRRAESLEVVRVATDAFPENLALRVYLLGRMRSQGDFTGFAEAALRLGEEFPKDEEVQLARAEALLALGRNQEAAEVAIQLASKAKSWPLVGVSENTYRAILIWVATRIRLGEPFEEPRLASILKQLSLGSTDFAMIEHWRQSLGGRRPYSIEDPNQNADLEFKQSRVFMGLVPNQMHGIEIFVNGVAVPLAIVDTGASHTLISAQVARQARVPTSSVSRSAVGSLSFVAKPAVIEELRIGDIVLRDVPVSVGDPPPLVMTQAKAALGIDLMHHLRFTLDYPARRVRVEPVKAPAEDGLASGDPSEGRGEDDGEVWDIPLWPFADHCLSQGELPDGRFARTLIDSGNFAYTLVWPTWGKENIRGHRGPTTSLFAYAMSNPERKIRGLRLGERELPAWPAMDMPPVTLQGVDMLDLLMGHDLLSQYRVTIDMLGRRLRLESKGGKLRDPVAPKLPGSI